MYKSKLDLLETEVAIKFVKDNFERELAKALKLTRVSAPLFVIPETGLNDNLNGVERPVRFDIKAINKDVEIVQSLAKWKRMALKKYGFAPNKEASLRQTEMITGKGRLFWNVPAESGPAHILDCFPSSGQ